MFIIYVFGGLCGACVCGEGQIHRVRPGCVRFGLSGSVGFCERQAEGERIHEMLHKYYSERIAEVMADPEPWLPAFTAMAA